jgi:hypothetical protein
LDGKNFYILKEKKLSLGREIKTYQILKGTFGEALYPEPELKPLDAPDMMGVINLTVPMLGATQYRVVTVVQKQAMFIV